LVSQGPLILSDPNLWDLALRQDRPFPIVSLRLLGNRLFVITPLSDIIDKIVIFVSTIIRILIVFLGKVEINALSIGLSERVLVVVLVMSRQLGRGERGLVYLVAGLSLVVQLDLGVRSNLLVGLHSHVVSEALQGGDLLCGLPFSAKTEFLADVFSLRLREVLRALSLLSLVDLMLESVNLRLTFRKHPELRV
jgi:hypothetical protein